MQPNYTFILIVLLVIPFQSLYAYYAISFFLLVLFTFKTKLTWNLPAKVLAVLILYYVFMSFFRWACTFEVNARDYVEAFRFFPLLYLMLKRRYFINISYDNIVRACFVFLLIDGTVSILQFTNFNFLGIIDIVGALYTSEGFIGGVDMSILHRTPGICAEIGGHGAVLMSMTIVMLSAIMNKCSCKLLSYVGFIICILLLVMSQSRTAIVATGIVLILHAIYYLAFGDSRQRRRIITLYIVLFVVCAQIFMNYVDLSRVVPYLTKMSNLAKIVGAPAGRFGKWGGFFDAAAQKPWWLLSGWGKHFFGRASGGFDSDYLFFFFVYGPLILMFLLLMAMRYAFKVLLNCRKYAPRNFEMPFFFVLMGGAIIAGVTGYFLLAQTVYLLYFLYCGRYWEKKAWKDSNPARAGVHRVLARPSGCRRELLGDL